MTSRRFKAFGLFSHKHILLCIAWKLYLKGVCVCTCALCKCAWYGATGIL